MLLTKRLELQNLKRLSISYEFAIGSSQGFGRLELSSLCSNVRLSVRSWNTGSWSEMLLGLSILIGSEEKSAGSYIMIEKLTLQ